MVSRLPDDRGIPSGGTPERLLYEEVRRLLPPREYETWFEDTPCKFFLPNRFVLSAPNRFRQAWIQDKYRALLHRCAASLFDFEPEIIFESPPADTPPERPRGVPLKSSVGRSPEDRGRDTAACRETPGEGPAVRSITRKNLNPELTFENFVPGPSSQVAHAAALAVIEKPGVAYNPLFIYGDPGVGKTHLFHAICHRLLEKHQLRVTYLKSEEFLNLYIAAIADSTVDSFRSRCRDTDVLLIDDIQFLSRKEKTQEELFHLFNTLIEDKRQIILSSTTSPGEITGLEERLVSRFRWGLVAHIEPPGFEVRVAILTLKARARNQELPLEVAELIATHTGEDPRELEGSLARVLSFAGMRDLPLSIETVRMALRHGFEEERRLGTTLVSHIIEAVSDHYGLKQKELLARSKARSFVQPRQVGMFLTRKLTQLSLNEIGIHFGGRDHSTVLHSLRQIESRRAVHPELQSDLSILKARILSRRR